jgi:hypothetical protein
MSYKQTTKKHGLSHQPDKAIIIGRGSSGVVHFFAKGSIVEPKTYDKEERSWLCKYVGNGLPDRDQYVHENDLKNFLL